MALALYEILITKLPREHQTLLGLFDVGTKDGYHLFWSFFCLTLPIFNTDMELKYPKFADHSGDVEQFARATVIYHKFERMDGRNMNQRHKVMKYLTTLSKAVDWPIVHVKLDCVSRCPGDLSLPVDSQYGTLPPSLSLAQVTADIMQYLRNRQHDPTLGNVDTYRRTNMLEAQLVNKGTVLKDAKISADRPLPFPTKDEFLKQLLEEVGDPDLTKQAKLRTQHNVGYRNLMGEIIYAMVTCRPDISYHTVKLAQSSARPADIHYRAAKSVLRYLYATRNDGIHYWRSKPNDILNDLPSQQYPI
eukprot:g12331.t1 g12331   contig6:1712669-1713580(-)